MDNVKSIVDRILEEDDFRSVLRDLKEVKNYNTRSFGEFERTIKEFDKKFQDLGVETKLDVDPTHTSLDWIVEKGYMSTPTQELLVKAYVNGNVDCDKAKKFTLPGSTNLNTLVDANQILKLIDGWLYTLEKEKEDKEDEDKDDEDKEDEDFELDPEIVSILERLKQDGNSLIAQARTVPRVNFKGKDYKVTDGKLYASTEQEVVASLEFPRAQEIDIYANTRDGQLLRRQILNSFRRNGFRRNMPEFRLDMDKKPYFYLKVGKMPVKELKGPEARAMLNYYDGNKVRFQPRSGD